MDVVSSLLGGFANSRSTTTTATDQQHRKTDSKKTAPSNATATTLMMVDGGGGKKYDSEKTCIVQPLIVKKCNTVDTASIVKDSYSTSTTIQQPSPIKNYKRKYRVFDDELSERDYDNGEWFFSIFFVFFVYVCVVSIF
ncbi:hypothetical protein HT594_00020 [Phenacoccus solenopsis nudivirus]|nr:hypothetical protein HT594_00020 [Phenacoccus solenopsis nudivirus]